MIGNPLITLDKIDSTNDYALRWYEEKQWPEGTIIRALDQFAGKGQHGNKWCSEPGKNLTFTLILKPTFLEPFKQFALNKFISLALLDFLEEEIADRLPDTKPQIKWPNDICVGSKKLAGILIENRIMGLKYEAAFIGIGFNLNQTHFPPDLPEACSLALLTGSETDPEKALSELCKYLNNRYLNYLKTGKGLLPGEYEKRLSGFGEWRNYRMGETLIEGMITGVDSFGRLRVIFGDGRTEYFNHGEIGFR